MNSSKSSSVAHENQLPIPSPRAVISGRRKLATVALVFFLATLGVACALALNEKSRRRTLQNNKTEAQPGTPQNER